MESCGEHIPELPEHTRGVNTQRFTSISEKHLADLGFWILSSVIVDRHVRDDAHDVALGSHSSRFKQRLAKKDAAASGILHECLRQLKNAASVCLHR